MQSLLHCIPKALYMCLVGRGSLTSHLRWREQAAEGESSFDRQAQFPPRPITGDRMAELGDGHAGKIRADEEEAFATRAPDQAALPGTRAVLHQAPGGPWWPMVALLALATGSALWARWGPQS